MTSEPAPPRSHRDEAPLELSRAIALLVVEDNPGDALLVRETLAAATGGRFKVATVERVIDAVAYLQQSQFDAILLDLSLPDSSGIDTLLGITSAAGDTPVVVLTGHDDPELETELVRRGVQEYLVKDEINRLALARSIRHAVERSRALLARRQVEEALRRSEANFRTLIESIPDAILVYRHGLLVYVNPAAVQLLAAGDRQDLLGKPIIDHVHPDDRSALALMSAASHPGEEAAHSRDVSLRGVDGTIIETEVLVINVDFGEGPAVLMVARDVTERKRVEARAIRADRAIALGVFAAGMAHEINNPLAYVIGNLDYLADEMSTLRSAGSGQMATSEETECLGQRWGELLETIDDAREGADRVRALVADLKILSRGTGQPRSSADAESILESTLRLMGGELRSRARIMRSYERVPPVRADPTLLAQVFLALLTNAVQALPPKAASRNEIGLAIHSDTPGQVTIEVRDNGRGLPPERAKRVFDPFFTTQEPGRGSGLGLSICQTIVADLGGEITLESRPGEGTTFRVMLPAG